MTYKRRPPSRHVLVNKVYRRILNDISSVPQLNQGIRSNGTNSARLLTGANSTPIGNAQIPSAELDYRNFRPNEVRCSTNPMHSRSLVAGPNAISNCRTDLGPNDPTMEPNGANAIQPTCEPIRESLHIPNLSPGLIFCTKCLGYGHYPTGCCNNIRCKKCFGYNHIARFCPNKKNCTLIYWIKKSAPVERNKS